MNAVEILHTKAIEKCLLVFAVNAENGVFFHDFNAADFNTIHRRMLVNKTQKAMGIDTMFRADVDVNRNKVGFLSASSTVFVSSFAAPSVTLARRFGSDVQVRSIFVIG